MCESGARVKESEEIVLIDLRSWSAEFRVWKKEEKEEEDDDEATCDRVMREKQHAPFDCCDDGNRSSRLRVLSDDEWTILGSDRIERRKNEPTSEKKRSKEGEDEKVGMKTKSDRQQIGQESNERELWRACKLSLGCAERRDKKSKD